MTNVTPWPARVLVFRCSRLHPPPQPRPKPWKPSGLDSKSTTQSVHTHRRHFRCGLYRLDRQNLFKPVQTSTQAEP